ncbi:MAG: agmatine deiminase family protein [Verrucomicrobia bacterium]|nr:agmatine deiminase family protein [Verrucomicrobiota bacterium]MBV8376618.1 agmatine deiminase family protein [Verrucomicrobiota bacterium]
MFSENLPAAQGYRLPAEWEPHEATWLSWPRREGISFPDAYDEVMPVFVQMVDALRGSEKVRINVKDEEHERDVRLLLKNIDTSHVGYFHIPTNEPWCRDHGPIFVKRATDPRLAIVDWNYNAWGGKYPPFDLDEVVPTRIAEQLGLPVFYPGLVMEGGSFDANGSGSLLTTASCLLNPNRNPGKSKIEIEKSLRDHLRVSNILWLGDGIEGDDTDGHIDDITRFVSRTTVLTAIEEDSRDRNFESLRANLALLRGMKTEDGTPLEVRTLPMPPRVEKEGRRLPASYANFYIANKVILLPVFCSANDERAYEVLQNCFPDRRIVPMDCTELVWGLGAFHCLTQQQPVIEQVTGVS